MAREDTQVNIRLPAELVERLKAAAETNGRSMTAEVVARLSESFPSTLDHIELEGLRRDAERTSALAFRLKFDPRATSPHAAEREAHKRDFDLVNRKLALYESEINKRTRELLERLRG